MADQGSWRNLLPDILGEEDRVIDLPPHPFFSAEMATKLSNEIESLLAHSEPFGDTIEEPLSDEAQLAFDEAEHLQKTFLRTQIEALHLLAAVLAHETSPSVKVFLAAGITKEVVLEKLRANGQEPAVYLPSLKAN